MYLTLPNFLHIMLMIILKIAVFAKIVITATSLLIAVVADAHNRAHIALIAPVAAMHPCF